MSNTQAQVQQAKSAQEALVIIARAIDALTAEVRQLSDTKSDTAWELWEPVHSALDPHEPEERRSEAEVTDSGVVVTLPTVSEEKQAARREFAKRWGVDDEYGEEICDAYAKGGPLYLYEINRDFVMALPPEARHAMVQDVFEESPSEAAEMSRDILKDMSPGVDQQTAVQNIETLAENL